MNDPSLQKTLTGKLLQTLSATFLKKCIHAILLNDDHDTLNEVNFLLDSTNSVPKILTTTFSSHDTLSWDAYTLLGAAIYKSHLELVKKLLAKGVDPLAKCYESKLSNRPTLKALDYAWQQRNREVLNCLLHWFDKNGKEGNTLLHYLAGSSLITGETLDSLDSDDLNAIIRSQIESENNEKEKPLHCAANVGNLSMFNWLRKHGANLIARDENDATPLHCVADDQNTKNELLSIIDTFQGNKEAANARDNQGKTPLHWAMRGGVLNWDIAKRKVARLIHVGAFLYREDYSRKTPVDELMDYIREHLEAGVDEYDDFGSQDVETIIKEKQQVLMKFLITCTREREGFLDTPTQTYPDGMVELFQRLEHTPVMRYIKNPDFTTLPFFTNDLARDSEETDQAYDRVIQAQHAFRNRLLGFPDELMRLFFLEVLIPWIHETRNTKILDIESAETFRHLKQLVNFYGKQEKPCDENNTATARPNP